MALLLRDNVNEIDDAVPILIGVVVDERVVVVKARQCYCWRN